MEKEIRPLFRYDIFGYPLVEIKNQYFFLSSLKKVFNSKIVKIWEGQRSLDISRVNSLTNVLYQEYLKTGSVNMRESILLCKKKLFDV